MQLGKQTGWGEAQFAREAEFAMQALRANPYTLGIAEENPLSLRDAIVQAAVLGITLNPAVGHGYLVPYKAPMKDGRRTGPPRVVLQPSYRGLRDLAIEDKLIKWCRAEIVYAKDTTSVHETEDGQRLISHQFDPFAKDRGAILGAYCAWLDCNDRRDLVFETIEEIYSSHRSRSEAWKGGQKGIWASDEPEAIRKALTKRAQKSWPRKTDRNESRFDAALAAEFEADDSIETTSTEVRRTPESARIAKPSETPHQGKAGNLKPEPEPEPANTLELTGDPSDEEAARALCIECDELLDNLAGGESSVRAQYEKAARESAGLGATVELDLAGLTALRDELAKAIAERAE